MCVKGLARCDYFLGTVVTFIGLVRTYWEKGLRQAGIGVSDRERRKKEKRERHVEKGSGGEAGFARLSEQRHSILHRMRNTVS